MADHPHQSDTPGEGLDPKAETFDRWFEAQDANCIESMSKRAVACEAWHHARRLPSIASLPSLQQQFSACKSSLRAVEAEVERWAAQTLKEDDCRQMWQARSEKAEQELRDARAELDRLAGLESESAEATEIVAEWRSRAEAADAREKQVRAETIESCAKIAVKVQYSDPEEAGACAAFEIAKAIRALANNHLASKEGGNA